ncbi:heptaprenyl diphosphate synthase [Moryella indoligenes]|uniref:Heptaprenyl diphosphate synthase n=1 Tax=Moryella indoligenes TaxID=371674 RepID=A0AAE3VAT3_9FIRM|nr:Gx transporter family protein [Moryella indoligenes]MDQ0152510.1 heptaprenyl diphosphate synthase [Moryella indoligenes]
MNSKRKPDGRSSYGAVPALFGMYVALALIMSYVETLIPISLGVPGVKLGLANLVSMICLYSLGAEVALAVTVSRIVLIGFSFGSMSAILYSLAGGLLSLVCMMLAKNSGLFDRTAVSIIGGVSHNIGQLCVAALVVETGAVFWYLPVLLLAGTLTGTLIGLLSGEVLRRLPKRLL